jgi:hypothetical protein
MSDSTSVESNNCKESPPSLHNVSAQIAFFSANVKGTKGMTVVTLDNTEG